MKINKTTLKNIKVITEKIMAMKGRLNKSNRCIIGIPEKQKRTNDIEDTSKERRKLLLNKKNLD